MLGLYQVKKCRKNIHVNTIYIKQKSIPLLVILITFLAVGYPVWYVAMNTTWAFDHTLLDNLYPFFGLIAMSLLWVHSIIGSIEPWLRKYIDFDWFVNITATVILISIILHPLLLFIEFNFNLVQIFPLPELEYLLIGLIAWLLLIIYDVGKLLKKLHFSFFARHWNAILIISNIGFLLAFFHALALKDDLQSEPLRTLWIFFGVTAFLSITYTYVIRPFLKKYSK